MWITLEKSLDISEVEHTCFTVPEFQVAVIGSAEELRPTVVEANVSHCFAVTWRKQNVHILQTNNKHTIDYFTMPSTIVTQLPCIESKYIWEKLNLVLENMRYWGRNMMWAAGDEGNGILKWAWGEKRRRRGKNGMLHLSFQLFSTFFFSIQNPNLCNPFGFPHAVQVMQAPVGSAHRKHWLISGVHCFHSDRRADWGEVPACSLAPTRLAGRPNGNRAAAESLLV